MTLLLIATGKSSIWMMADRRLSHGDGLVASDNATKLVSFDGTDGTALLGYAGLGRTAAGMEPSEWMVGVLRGPKMTVQSAIHLLAGQVRSQVPVHLAGLPADSRIHAIGIVAILDAELQTHTISLDNGKVVCPRLQRTPGGLPMRLLGGGSGHWWLTRNENRPDWRPRRRKLLDLINRFEEGKVPALTVAGCFAEINKWVAEEIGDETVGPDCIVSWRVREVGGGTQFFAGIDRAATSGGIPSVVGGLDMGAIGAAMMQTLAVETERYIDPDGDKFDPNPSDGPIEDFDWGPTKAALEALDHSTNDELR